MFQSNSCCTKVLCARLCVFLIASLLPQSAASTCDDEVLLFSVTSMTYGDVTTHIASMDDVCPPVVVTSAPPANSSLNATTEASHEDDGAGTTSARTCVHYDACVLRPSSIPTKADGDVFVPAMLITGALSGYLSSSQNASVLRALFSSLWSVDTVVDGGMGWAVGAEDAGPYHCSLDVLWETTSSRTTDAPPSAATTSAPPPTTTTSAPSIVSTTTPAAVGARFALVLNAPQWSAALRNTSLYNRNISVETIVHLFTTEQPKEVLRAGRSLFEPQTCNLLFGAAGHTNASQLFQTLFGSPDVTTTTSPPTSSSPSLARNRFIAEGVSSGGSTGDNDDMVMMMSAAAVLPLPAYVWSPGGLSSLHVVFDASIERIVDEELEEAMVAAVLLTSVLLLPTVPLMSGVAASGVLLFASPYCTSYSAGVRSLQRGRYGPLSSLLGSAVSFDDFAPNARPLLTEAVSSGVVCACVAMGVVVLRSLWSWRAARGSASPFWQGYDALSRILLSIPLLAPVAAALLLGALLGPTQEHLISGLSNSSTAHSPQAEGTSWASSGAWWWTYVLLGLVMLHGLVYLSVGAVWLPLRTSNLYSAVDAEVVAAVSSARYVRPDAPRGIIALVLAVVELEGFVQPTMVLLRPFSSMLCVFRGSWFVWGVLSSTLPWVHAMHIAVPNLSCGVAEIGMAVCWVVALAVFCASRLPLWSRIEALVLTSCMILLTVACGCMASFHISSDEGNRDLLAAGQLITLVLACVVLLWTLASGLFSLTEWYQRMRAIHGLWEGDESLWWRQCVRAPVASILQQNVSDDDDGVDATDDQAAVPDKDKEVPAERPRTRAINLLTDNLDDYANDDDAFGHDDLILMQYVGTHNSFDAGPTSRLQQLGVMRSVEVGAIDAQLIASEPASPESGNERSPTRSCSDASGEEESTSEDEVGGDVDDVVVDYADVELLGGTINGNAVLRDDLL